MGEVTEPRSAWLSALRVCHHALLPHFQRCHLTNSLLSVVTSAQIFFFKSPLFRQSYPMIRPSSHICLETRFDLIYMTSAVTMIQGLTTRALSWQYRGLLTWEIRKVSTSAPRASYNVWQDYALGMPSLQTHRFWGNRQLGPYESCSFQLSLDPHTSVFISSAQFPSLHLRSAAALAVELGRARYSHTS